MWPPSLLHLMNGFANTGEFTSLYRMLLELAFPATEGFKVSMVKANTILDAEGTHLGVCSPNNEFILLLTWDWHNPNNAIRSRCFRAKIRDSGRFARVHAAGIFFACYEVTTGDLHSSGDYLVYSSDWSPLGDAPREIFDANIFDELGFSKIREFFAQTRQQARMPQQCMLPNFSDPKILRKWKRKLDAFKSEGVVEGTPCSVNQGVLQDGTCAESMFETQMPVEVILWVLDYLGVEDLRNFALLNKRCCEIADRRLWRIVTLGSFTSTVPSSFLLSQCQALLHRSNRSRDILRLVLSPCSRSWDDALIESFKSIWGVLPNLRDLLFCSPDRDQIAPRRSIDFSPIIPGLIAHGKHLQLRVFRYDTWLTPHSPILSFLKEHPLIEELVGVDITQSQLPTLAPSFLPNLRVLVCNYAVTGVHIMPGWPVETVSVRQHTPQSLLSFLQACQQSSVPISNLCYSPFEVTMSDFEVLESLATSLPLLKTLELWRFYVDEQDATALRFFPALEELRCTTSTSVLNEESVREWASGCRTLKKVVFQ